MLWQRKESFHHGNNLEHINSVIKHVLKAFLKTTLVAQMAKRLPAMWETHIRSLGWEDPQWQPTPVFLPGKFHVQRSLVGYSPWGHKE